MIYGPHKSSGCGDDIMRQDVFKFNFSSSNHYPRNYICKMSGCRNGELYILRECVIRPLQRGALRREDYTPFSLHQKMALQMHF